MFPSIQPMLIHFLARKLWHIENLKFYFTLPSKEQDLETVQKFKSAIEDVQTNKVTKLPFYDNVGEIGLFDFF